MKEKHLPLEISTAKLAENLKDYPTVRHLLVQLENDKMLNDFVNNVEIPSDKVSALVGSTKAYTNLEVILPGGESFFDVVLTGNVDLMWTIHADSAVAAGIRIADVRRQEILLDGDEHDVVPLSICRGVLHKEWQRRK